jgi:hypothetical protein
MRGRPKPRLLGVVDYRRKGMKTNTALNRETQDPNLIKHFLWRFFDGEALHPAGCGIYTLCHKVLDIIIYLVA